MQQVFFVSQFLVDFAVDFDVLEAAVENNQDFRVDHVVVEVGDQAFEEKFEGGCGGDVFFVFTVHALEQIYPKRNDPYEYLQITCFSFGSFWSRWNVAFVSR